MAVGSSAVPLARSVKGLAAGLLCWALGAWGVEAQQAVSLQAERVVAFGDVHGGYDELTKLLVSAGLVDAELSWRGGRTHLISLGDLVDRGPDSRRVMDLLRRLDEEATAAGGRVHVLLGNHELMNLTGDLRYVSASDVASFADTAEPDADAVERRRAAFAPDGVYGRWLLGRPVALVVNDTAFVHGGLSPVLDGSVPQETNAAFSANLSQLLDLRAELARAGVIGPDEAVDDAAVRLASELQQREASAVPAGLESSARRFVELSEQPLFGSDGPLWYRGTAWCHPLLEQPVLDRVLEAWRAARVVVGHTPTADHRVHARLDGRALLIDTGMLASHYRGQASALILEPGQPPRVLYADEAPAAVLPEVDDGTLLSPVSEAEVVQALQNEPLSLLDEAERAPDGAQPARLADSRLAIQIAFTPASRRRARAEVAAWRLDRLLQLHLVAPVAARQVDGRYGVVRAVWPDALSESERMAANVAVPDPCGAGSHYDLVYAFDALVANAGRTPETLLYDRRTWRLASVGHARSFGRSGRFPAYLANAPHRLPPALAERLRALDPAMLGEHLGDLLDEAEIEAVLERRDELLDTWTTGG